MLQIAENRIVLPSKKVCLAAANLDYAGLYDPDKHKFNGMSEAVIDPSLNASADPTPVLMLLQETILRAVREGTPLAS